MLFDPNRGLERVGIRVSGGEVGEDKEDAGLPRLQNRIVWLGAITAWKRRRTPSAWVPMH